jgi:hypothetical protein
MRIGKLEVQRYLATLVFPVVAFGLPVHGVWNFHTAESVADRMSGEPLPLTFDGTFPLQAMVIDAG